MIERYVVLSRPAIGKLPATTETVLVTEHGYEYAGGGAVFSGGAAEECERARAATDEEVAAFRVKREEVKARRVRQHELEAEFLALCGLTHGDFSRFRSVFRDGDVLHVETRENGTNTRSVGAIRNPHYLRSCADDFDGTYEHYEFRVPTTEPDNV